MDGFAHAGVDNQAHEGKSNVWLTPRFILDALGPFDLDPCAEPGWPTATQHISLPDNGLVAEWNGFVLLYNHGIALVFARTDTRWFQRAASKCSAMFFLVPRVTFLKPDHSTDTNAGCGSCLIAFGDLARARLFQCTLRGTMMSTLKAHTTLRQRAAP